MGVCTWTAVPGPLQPRHRLVSDYLPVAPAFWPRGQGRPVLGGQPFLDLLSLESVTLPFEFSILLSMTLL